MLCSPEDLRPPFEHGARCINALSQVVNIPTFDGERSRSFVGDGTFSATTFVDANIRR